MSERHAPRDVDVEADAPHHRRHISIRRDFMAIELVRARPEHAPALGRIFFDAFEGIAAAHGFPMDVPDVGVANQLMDSLTHRPDYYGVVAMVDGLIAGCNFTQLSDAVSGVGPICIDPKFQSRGTGRKLMAHIVEYSLKAHGPMVRLLQDTFNMASLSLYASLGFTVQEPMLLMRVEPANAADGSMRPLVPADVEACDELCRAIYRVSRKNELVMMIRHGPEATAIPLGLFKNGAVTGFLIPGFLGFGVAETDADILDLAQQAALQSPPHVHRLFVPSRRGELLRSALKRGFKSLKLMSLMSIGPYESPSGPWCSSVIY
jgi:GNAT superfamily N-acetyltransferase